MSGPTCLGVNRAQESSTFATLLSTKPHTLIGFGAVDVTIPYTFIGFGAMDFTNPYKSIGFSTMNHIVLGT